jgi:hypothetical protein
MAWAQLSLVADSPCLRFKPTPADGRGEGGTYCVWVSEGDWWRLVATGAW